MTQAAQLATRTSGKVVYTAKTHTTGGRENGVSRSADGRLDIRLSPPGSSLPGTNPEQLFAAGWSAVSKARSGSWLTRRRSRSRTTWRSTPKSTSMWTGPSTSSARASTSPFPVSSGASPKAWSKPALEMLVLLEDDEGQHRRHIQRGLRPVIAGIRPERKIR